MRANLPAERESIMDISEKLKEKSWCILCGTNCEDSTHEKIINLSAAIHICEEELANQVPQIIPKQIAGQVESDVIVKTAGENIMQILQELWDKYSKGKAIMLLRNNETGQLAIYTRGKPAERLIEYIKRFAE